MDSRKLLAAMAVAFGVSVALLNLVLFVTENAFWIPVVDFVYDRIVYHCTKHPSLQ